LSVEPRPTTTRHIKAAIVRTYGVKMQIMRPPLPILIADWVEDLGGICEVDVRMRMTDDVSKDGLQI
jgi:hypothetical protein